MEQFIEDYEAGSLTGPLGVGEAMPYSQTTLTPDNVTYLPGQYDIPEAVAQEDDSDDGDNVLSKIVSGVAGTAQGLLVGSSLAAAKAYDAGANMAAWVAGRPKSTESMVDQVTKGVRGLFGDSVGDWFENVQTENSTSTNLAADFPAIVAANFGIGKAGGLIMSKLAGAKFLGTGKVSSFLKTLGANNSMEAATLKGTLADIPSFWATAARETGKGFAADLATIGWWGMQEDETGVHINKPAVATNLGINAILGSMVGGYRWAKAAKKMRVAAQTNDTAAVREAVKDLQDQGIYNHFGKDGTFVRDATVYMETRNLQHEISLGDAGAAGGGAKGGIADAFVGQAEQQYRLTMAKVLGVSTDFFTNKNDTAHEVLFRRLHDICFGGGNKSAFNTIVTHTHKAGEKLAEKLNSKVHIRGIQMDVSRGVYAKAYKHASDSFDKLIAKDEAAMWIDKDTGAIYEGLTNFDARNNKNTILLTFKRHKDPLSNGYLMKAAQERMAYLEYRATESFITSGKDYLPELTGKAGELTDDFVDAFGKADTKEYGASGLISTYNQKAMDDPMRKSIENIGERVNRMRLENKRSVLAQQEEISKLIFNDKDEAVQAAVLEVGKMQDALTRGFDVEPGYHKLADGSLTIKVKDTTANAKNFARFGLDADECDWLLPDVTSLYQKGGAPVPAKISTELGKDIQKKFDAIQAAIDKAKGYADALDPVTSPSSLKAHYIAMMEKNPEQFYRVLERNGMAGGKDYVTFMDEVSAQKFLAQQAQQGNANKWSWEIAKGNKQFEQRMMKSGMEPRYIGAETSGKSLGHQGGSMYNNPFERLRATMQAQVKAVDAASIRVAQAAYDPLMRQASSVVSEKTMKEMEQVLVGNLPDIPFVRKLDEALDGFLNWSRGWSKAKPDLDPENLYQMVGNELREPLRARMAELTGMVSKSYYTWGNFRGALVNLLSTLQGIPLATNWYRPLTRESASEYMTRTGFKMADGSIRGVGYMDAMHFATRSIRRMFGMTDADKALVERARIAGVVGNDIKALEEFYNPQQPTTMLGKAWKTTENILSWPTMKTEEWSRILALFAGDEYASSVLKLDGKQRIEWAVKFAEESMGSYSPFKRIGLSNYPVTAPLGLFQTFNLNLMFRNLDFIANQDARKFVAANLTNSMLFGAKSAPFVGLWVSKYDFDDEWRQDILLNGGIAGLMNLGIGRAMHQDERGLLSSLRSPANVNFVKGTYNFTSKAMAELMTGGGIQSMWELASTELPITFVRRLIQGAQGYSVSAAGNIIFDARNAESLWDETVGRLKLWSGIMSYEDLALQDIDRVERTREAEMQNSRKRLMKLVKTATRQGTSLDGLINEAVRLYGEDPEAMTSALMRAIEEAPYDIKMRMLREASEHPESLSPLGMYALQRFLD